MATAMPVPPERVSFRQPVGYLISTVPLPKAMDIEPIPNGESDDSETDEAEEA